MHIGLLVTLSNKEQIVLYPASFTKVKEMIYAYVECLSSTNHHCFEQLFELSLIVSDCCFNGR